MTFPLSSSPPERELSYLSVEVEEQYRRGKTEEPATRVLRIAGHPFIIRPASRKVLNVLNQAAAMYADPRPYPSPNAPIKSGLRGSPHLVPFTGLESPLRTTVFPKPEVLEAQNLLLWECVLYPDYETIRRMLNCVVMACLRYIYGLSGADDEAALFQVFREQAATIPAGQVIQVAKVFGLDPGITENWTQEKFLKYLALSEQYIALTMPQEGVEGVPPGAPPGAMPGNMRSPASKGRVNTTVENRMMMG